MSATSNIDVLARLKLAAEIPARFTVDKFRESRAAGLILKYRVVLIGIVQACLIFCALLVAWLLRFNFYLP